MERGWIRKASERQARGGGRGIGRVTRDERRAALDADRERGPRLCTAADCTRDATKAVPGEGDPDTEVVFVGEGPGFNEDREGRPFVGRAGGLLVRLLAAIGWGRDDVFITNVVKCRPPDNRDPQPDEIAACAPYLRRQLEVLDPAVVVTLGRYSMATFMPGARIGQVARDQRPGRSRDRRPRRARVRDVPPGGRAADAALERESFEDIARVPSVLVRARERREGVTDPGAPTGRPDDGRRSRRPPRPVPAPAAPAIPAISSLPVADHAADDAYQLTLFTA